MSEHVRGVNVSVTPMPPGERAGKIAQLSVGGRAYAVGVEWLDAAQVDELIGLLLRCKNGRAEE